MSAGHPGASDGGVRGAGGVDACAPPTVSVIVPVYNVAPYVRRCLDSIAAQTRADFEAILVDDGSTDGSSAICREFAARDRRFSCIHQANQGLSAARNAGIDRARGAYFALIDSDDFVEPNYLERMVAALEGADADIAVCANRFWMEADAQPGPYRGIIRHVEVTTGVEACAELIATPRSKEVVAWGKLYRRELFCGIRYPVGRLHEDEFTTPRLMLAARRVVYIPDELYWYVRRAGSIMRSLSLEGRDRIDAAVEMVELMRDVSPDLLRRAEATLVCSCCDKLRAIAGAGAYGRLKGLYREIASLVDVGGCVRNPHLSAKQKVHAFLAARTGVLYRVLCRALGLLRALKTRLRVHSGQSRAQ